MGFSAEAYARMLKRLLPPGKLWNLLPDSVLSKVFLAVGDELARVDTRGAALIEETDPRTASETLYDWERLLGLPDEDVPEIPATDAARRRAVTTKFIRRGGQTPAYLVGLALSAGWVVSITEGYAATVFRTGPSTCIDPMRTPEWAHVFKVQVDHALPDALSLTEMQALIRRAAPAHCEIQWEIL